MTSTVTSIPTSVDRNLILKLFERFSSKYGKLWTARLGESGDWEYCLQDWLRELQVFSVTDLRSAVNKALAIYRDYPPTQGQLVDLCLKESGVPDENEIVRQLARRDFNHPIVKMIYDRVGGWTLSNAKEQEINSRVKEYYRPVLAEFMSATQDHWATLNAFHDQKKLEKPQKQESKRSHVSFKERLEEYQRHADSEKEKLQNYDYQEFNSYKIKRGHVDFDINVFEMYKKYLMSVPEKMVLALPVSYAYDRSRFLRQSEAVSLLNKHKSESNQSSAREPQRRSAGPEKLYKTWNSD